MGVSGIPHDAHFHGCLHTDSDAAAVKGVSINEETSNGS